MNEVKEGIKGLLTVLAILIGVGVVFLVLWVIMSSAPSPFSEIAAGLLLIMIIGGVILLAIIQFSTS